MDQILEYDEEMEEDPYEYNVPLSGELTSPSMRRESEDRYNDDREGSTPASESFRDSESRWTGDSYRQSMRSSQQSDATPRFHNRANGGRVSNGLPSIPFQDHSSPRSVKRDHSQTSLSTYMSKNSVTFQLEREDYDSISEPSLHHHSISGPLTPTSNAASSYNGRTPEGSRRAVRQIGMDGGVKTLPLPDDTHDSASSTMHSTSASYNSREKSHDDKRKSYFTSTQEQFMSTDDLDDPIPGGSMRSVISERYPTSPNKDNDGASSDDEDKMYDPVVICGFVLPLCLGSAIKQIPSLNRISLFLVNILPCFWCCGNTSQGSSTDRSVLTRLNIICLLLTVVQVIMSMWLFIVLLILDDDPGIFGNFAPHLWNLNGAVLSIGILAVILMLTCTCTIRVVREVDLVGAIRYLWVLLWILPFEIFFTISLYDYHHVTQVWIHHWWLEPQMSWFRARYCPTGTENTKCLVPIMGEPDFDSESDWCLAKYNATDCSDIRDTAESDMFSSMLRFYTFLAGWSSAVLFVIMLIVNSLERIITKPIVQKARESNVPLWLSLPSITNMLVGSVLLFSQSSLLNSQSGSGSESSWIGIVYLVTGGLFLVALLMGWYLSAYTIRNHADKQSKNVAVIIMIIMMAANVVMLVAIFVASIIFSADLIHSSPLDQTQRADVACRVDRNVTCTACDSLVPEDRCPEWSLGEVTQILQTQLKQSATLASIFVLYAISVLRFGVTLRRHLSLYQIDYV